jgi:hypothetical protein
MIVSQKNFSLIPLIDFKNKIDDEKLYKYFNFSEEEIKHIENTIGTFIENE